MEISSSSIPNCDGEGNALRSLLEAFGSMFTFEEINSAYCNASKNADLAGQILCDMQGSSSSSSPSFSTFSSSSASFSSSSSSSSVVSNGEVRDDVSLELAYGYTQKSCHGNVKSRTGKQKWRTVSMGTVTGVLGKDYVNPSPVTNASCIPTKPLKLDVKEVPLPRICEEATNTDLSNEARMDMEDFLFRILGDGFKLDMETIQEVLETCGYDMGKSMDKLIDMTAVVSDQTDEYAGKSTQKFTCSNPGVSSHNKNGQASTFYEGITNGVSNPSEEELQEQEKARHELGKEVLASLFSPAERYEELPRKIGKAGRRRMPYGEPVVPPPCARILHEAPSDNAQQPNEYEEGDKKYQLLREAVIENRVTMREYYKAAVDSFAKRDYDRANKLMEKGHIFREKAQEADHQSSEMIFKSNNDSKDEIKLDLHEHDAREAIRTLKCHLPSLAGIPSFKYLKLIVDANVIDSTKGTRRRLVVKLLERESIKWTEGADAGIIMVHLESINPRKLSFANK